jgi:hypothetical protein
MLFIVVERFRETSAPEAYRRFNEHGRLAPDDLKTHGSWVAADLTLCVQIIEAKDLMSIQQWVANWLDLIEFEILPGVPGSAVAQLFADANETLIPG